MSRHYPELIVFLDSHYLSIVLYLDCKENLYVCQVLLVNENEFNSHNFI